MKQDYEARLNEKEDEHQKALEHARRLKRENNDFGKCLLVLARAEINADGYQLQQFGILKEGSRNAITR